MIWSGPTNDPSHAGEMFRVELAPTRIDLVWYDPNPHAGHEFGEHHSLEEFLTHAAAQDSILRVLGEVVLGEILVAVKRYLG